MHRVKKNNSIRVIIKPALIYSPALYNEEREREPVENLMLVAAAENIENDYLIDAKPTVVQTLGNDTVVDISSDSDSEGWVESNGFEYLPRPQLEVKNEIKEEDGAEANACERLIKEITNQRAKKKINMVVPVPIGGVKSEGFLWLPVPQPSGEIKAEESTLVAPNEIEPTSNPNQVASHSRNYDGLTGFRVFQTVGVSIVYLLSYKRLLILTDL